MRSIVAILLLFVGALLGLYFLAAVLGTATKLSEWISEGSWLRIGKLLLIIIVVGILAWASLAAGWSRRAALRDIKFGLPAFLSNLPRVPVSLLLPAIAVALAVTAVAVAFHINRLEFNEFIAASAKTILPWDPTHTARKYLILAFVVAAGAFAWFRHDRHRRNIALLPALMLTLAVPLGAVGYEMKSSYWSYSFWIEKGMDGRAEMTRVLICTEY